MGSRSQLVRRLAALCVALMLLAGALTVALVAYSRSSGVGACVNQTLNTRNPATVAETDALLELADHLQRLVTADPAHGAQAQADFIAEAKRFQVELRAVKRTRSEHPLGRC